MKTGFLKRIAAGGSLSLVKLVAGLAKIKVLALLLGVDGLGLLSLGLQFQATSVSLVSMSLTVGVINIGRPLWVAEDVKATGAVLGSALALVAINALIFLGGLALFQNSFDSSWVRAFEAQGVSLLWPLALAAVVTSFANVLWESLSFLVDRFDIYVRTNMVAALCDATLFAGGAWLFGLTGALIAPLLGSLSLFMIYTVFSIKAPATQQILVNLCVERQRVAPLLSYSALMLITTAMGLACMFLARAHLTLVAGVAANGYLQVVTALEAYFLPFVMTGVWGHLHPSVAASGDTLAARVELRGTLIVSMRLAAAGCIAVVVGAPLLVQLVYTSAFLPARQYIAIYFAGELFFMFLSVMGVYLLALGRKRVYFLGYAVYHGVLLVGVSMTAATLGPWAYVLSHVAGSTLLAVLTITYSVRSGLLDLPTLRDAGVCVIAAAACCVLDNVGLSIELGALTVRASWILGPIVILFVMRPYLNRLFHMDFHD